VSAAAVLTQARCQVHCGPPLPWLTRLSHPMRSSALSPHCNLPTLQPPTMFDGTRPPSKSFHEIFIYCFFLAFPSPSVEGADPGTAVDACSAACAAGYAQLMAPTLAPRMSGVKACTLFEVSFTPSLLFVLFLSLRPGS
jgi:hypothetical protein